MSPVVSVTPARTTLPCDGTRYRPVDIAVTLDVTPRCLWCREFIGEEGGACLGFLEPEKVTRGDDGLSRVEVRA